MGTIQEPTKAPLAQWLQSNNNSQEEPYREGPPAFLMQSNNNSDNNGRGNLRRSPSLDSSLNSSYEALPLPVVEGHPVQGGSIRYHLRFPRNGTPLFDPQAFLPGQPPVEALPLDAAREPHQVPPAPPPPPNQQLQDNQSHPSNEFDVWGTWLLQVPHGKIILCVGSLFACYGAGRCFNDRKKYWSVMAPFLKKYLPLLFEKKKKRKKQRNKVYLLPTT